MLVNSTWINYLNFFFSQPKFFFSSYSSTFYNSKKENLCCKNPTDVQVNGDLSGLFWHRQCFKWHLIVEQKKEDTNCFVFRRRYNLKRFLLFWEFRHWCCNAFQCCIWNLKHSIVSFFNNAKNALEVKEHVRLCINTLKISIKPVTGASLQVYVLFYIKNGLVNELVN